MQLKIVGMTCEHCVRAVTRAVEAVPGVAAVRVDLARGLVDVQGDANPQDVAAAVVEEGYAVAP